MSIVIALDIGTSKLCALAFCRETCKVLAVVSAPNDADVADLAASRHEQDPLRIRGHCIALLKKLLRSDDVASNEVAGIGTSGQMHGVLLVDDELVPLANFITWRDERTLEPAANGSLDEALARLDASLPARAGTRLNAGYGAATLFWLSQNGQLPSGARALTIADYVTACLCGCASTEPTHAASWGILDATRRKWDADSIERLGLPTALFPAIRPSATPIGVLVPDVARELGLPGSVQVCAPVGDNQASVIGAAGFNGDVAIVNLGTGGQISVRKGEYEFVQHLETRPMPFGGYILVGTSLCGGWSYAYLCGFFDAVISELAGVDIPQRELYARMNQLVAEAPAGAGGLAVDTRFSGTRSDPEIRGGVVGIDRHNLTPGNLARAFAEGMVRELVETGRAAGISHVSRVVAGGNAVRENPVVAETIEKEFGLTCHVGPAREEAALGAAYCTAVGLGLLSVADINRACAP